MQRLADLGCAGTSRGHDLLRFADFRLEQKIKPAEVGGPRSCR